MNSKRFRLLESEWISAWLQAKMGMIVLVFLIELLVVLL
jgi:hypothetical protein